MSALHGAHDFVLDHPRFINQVFSDGSRGAGLEKLRIASIPGAAHDSSERYPPPTCHPGTRQDYIERLTGWGLNANNSDERLTWLKGPAGVGKSAVAQSCAEALGDKLGASFFFSRSNHRDDPGRFFPSIAYQLTEKFHFYGAFLGSEIRRRPSLVEKALPHQFRDLFVTPFTYPAIKEEVGERVIIVDGLDECARKEAQVDIIKIVAESVRAGTTPFLWIFLSRLEPKIVATFDLPNIKSISQQINLPISREIDKEILLYLADKFQEIGREYQLALPWPSEEEVWALVDFSAGLFACAHAIIHFVGAESPAGPVKQLHAVLQLAKRLTKKSRSHPLAALDELYTLVMERVPLAMLQTVQWILLSTRISTFYATEHANLLGLSELQFRHACRCLHAVMVLGEGELSQIVFYHTSFIDFLEDPSRSGRFCVWSDCAVTLLEVVVQHLNQIKADIDNHGRYAPLFDLTWASHDMTQQRTCYSFHVRTFFKILSSIHLDDDARILPALINFDFKKISFRWYFVLQPTSAEIELLTRNLYSRLDLLRPCRLQNWRASFRPELIDRYYTIGHGKKKALMKMAADNRIWVEPYSPRDFQKWARQLYEVAVLEMLSS